jgi:hypothetical protein
LPSELSKKNLSSYEQKTTYYDFEQTDKSNWHIAKMSGRGRGYLVADHGRIEREHFATGEADREAGLVLVLLLLGLFPENELLPKFIPF